MDCLTAQSLISEAIDREPLDAARLAEAKEHCRTCSAASWPQSRHRSLSRP